MNTIKYSTNPYNVNRMTMAAGTAALKDNGYYMDNCRKIIESREYTASALRNLGFTLTDSKANFVFAKHNTVSGEKIYKDLKDNGILVRHFTSERICEYNRITVGTAEEVSSLLTVLDKIL